VSADLLRRAASLMRERAGTATRGPWFLAYSAVISEPLSHEFEAASDELTDDDDDAAWDALPEYTLAIVPAAAGDTPTVQGAHDGTHIASWHPAVALAVADWLDSMPPWTIHSHLIPHHVAALAVARAYLGEPA
jgi:hypothetical protein